MACILLVDDEEGIRRAFFRILRAEGYDVVAVGSVAEAMTALEGRADISMILSDVMMPGDTGVDFHRQFSEALLARGIQFALMSGGMSVECSKYVLARPIPLLGKPATREELLAFIAARLAVAA